jgi:uncharacterized protein (TIGR02996 family)
VVSHPDYDALLAGVLADPDADLPRLVLADWLEETGHPANYARAEYIRAAIEFEREPPPEAEREAKCVRICELEGMFEDEWGRFDRSGDHGGRVHVERRRGFVESVSLYDWAARRVFHELSRHPVQYLSVRMGADFDIEYTQRPSLHCVESVAFMSMFQVSVVNDCLATVDFPRLRHLDLRDSAIDDGHVVRLLQIVHENASFNGLQHLELSNNAITDLAAHAIAASRLPQTMSRISIAGTRITNAGREVLFRRFGFEELRPRV